MDYEAVPKRRIRGVMDIITFRGLSDQNDESSSLRLKKLDLALPTLTYRRSRGDQIKFFKVVTNKYDKECTEGLFRMREDSVTRGHEKKIFKTRARLNGRKYSFSKRVVSVWNSPPDRVVGSKTVAQFETRLDKYW
ncbi:uncharacterized protein LOC143028072 [Oratosquilla oratoria]|uniref:uncharacterized protein LOC143028072 n=1 Tax=Oratosquilla oratoria TaxID=337810 RepID=UPI003F75D4FE